MANVNVDDPDNGMKEIDDVKKEALGSMVASHYNNLQEAGLDKRVQSRIFYMRNFNNWIKSMCIGDALERIRDVRGHNAELTVLDLCAGKGGDLQKWKKGRISRLVLADIAGTSMEQAEERYKENLERNSRERNPSKLFSAEFHTADCSKQRLKDMYKAPMPAFDLVSCQFSFHYSLETYAQTEMMLRNACECLKPGGFFFGTTPNSYELVKRLRAAEGMSFGNEVYRVTFQTEDKDNIPLFGARYDFHLEGVVDCPEFLVYFPMLEKMAEKFGMKLVYKYPFAEFFQKHLQSNEGRGLLGRMQSLESYPAADDVELMTSNKESYAKAHEAVEKLKADQKNEQHSHQQYDRRGPKPIKVGTMSQEEWEATTVYLVYCFEKVGDGTPDSATGATSTAKEPRITEGGEDGPVPEKVTDGATAAAEKRHHVDDGADGPVAKTVTKT